MSYVLVTLDTTPPQIQIFAPSYTTRELTNYITIRSNEPISSYQEVYVIDSDNVRHDYTFKKEVDSLIGTMKFSNFPLGSAIIYATLADEVENLSETASKPIHIRENLTSLRLDIKDYAAQVAIEDNTAFKLIQMNDTSRKITITEGVPND